MKNRNPAVIVVAIVVLVATTALVLRMSRRPTAETPAEEPVRKPVQTVSPRPTVTDTGVPTATDSIPPEGMPGPDAAVPRQPSEAVQIITGLHSEKKDYKARVKGLRMLTRDILPWDKQALMTFLRESRAEEQEDMRPLEFNAVKNDVLDILLRQHEIPPDIGKHVVSMYRDEGNDDVWRDYCVQYLSACYEATKPTGVATNEPDRIRADIQEAYWEAVEETDKTIAGTALLALERLSRKDAEFDREKIGALALEVATTETGGKASRITAFRMCALMGRKEVLASARETAQVGESTMLRMAAAATIGDLGEKEDEELLLSLSGSDEKRISAVAGPALERLRKRLKAEEGREG